MTVAVDVGRSLNADIVPLYIDADAKAVSIASCTVFDVGT